MADDNAPSENVFQSIMSRLADVYEAFFRHIVFGLFLIVLLSMALPDKFKFFDLSHLDWHNLVFYLVAGSVLGSVWYAIHRLIVHTLVDYCVWFDWHKARKIEYPKDTYSWWLANHLMRANGNDINKVRSIIRFRSAMIHLAYCVAESIIIVTITVCVTIGSKDKHFWWLMIGTCIFVAAMLQQRLFFKIDEMTTDLAEEKKDASKIQAWKYRSKRRLT